MSRLTTIAHDVQDRTADWMNDPSAHADVVVQSVLSRIDHAKVPQVIAGLVAELTGNKKSAERARKAAATALQRAERRLKRRQRGHGSTWLVAGILSAALVGGILVWRRIHSRWEQEEYRDHPGPAASRERFEGTDTGRYPEGDHGLAGQVAGSPDDHAEGSYADVEPASDAPRAEEPRRHDN